jgi:Na+-transporting NADH:ubiquinone oxidoreductase subunit NqrD
MVLHMISSVLFISITSPMSPHIQEYFVTLCIILHFVKVLRNFLHSYQIEFFSGYFMFVPLQIWTQASLIHLLRSYHIHRQELMSFLKPALTWNIVLYVLQKYVVEHSLNCSDMYGYEEMGRVCSMHGMDMKCVPKFLLWNLKGRGYLEM